jgi:hypothetical protein
VFARAGVTAPWTNTVQQERVIASLSEIFRMTA